MAAAPPGRAPPLLLSTQRRRCGTACLRLPLRAAKQLPRAEQWPKQPPTPELLPDWQGSAGWVPWGEARCPGEGVCPIVTTARVRGAAGEHSPCHRGHLGQLSPPTRCPLHRQTQRVAYKGC